MERETYNRNRLLSRLAAGCSILILAGAIPSFAYDVSQPAMIQMFESSWVNNQRRAPDLFMAGYGQIWIPPAYRADSGNQSVGYDVYDRFDLGTADNPTLYGTEGTLKRANVEMHRAGLSVYADSVWNHNGFSTYSSSFFANAGGYPGFVPGDFHNTNIDVNTDQYNGRTSGLLDIAQESNNAYVRNPIPGNPNNLPAGTVAQFGRLANVPSDANRRFYPDRDRAPDRIINGTQIWDFTSNTAVTGNPIAENATGYMMRHAQWMLQEIGVDGFRLDATKHVPNWVFNDFFDLAVSGANPRLNLDGSRKSVFSFGENFDTNKAYLQSYIRKDTTGNLARNRDTKDFPLYFALQQNLTSNGLNNDWRNVVNASVDSQDDGIANNGSQGVGFVQSADSFGPDLSNVAYAYSLMRPGNQIVYFNAKEFGNARDFPKDGRGDALGGLYGESVTTLTNLRNTHGRGNYIERWINKENLVYERDKSAIVALSNRTDNGYDSYTIQTNFGAGTRLIEATGNAMNAAVDPTNQIADYVVVDSQGRVNINVPRNRNVNGVLHGNGYVIYTLPTPQGTLEIQNKSATIVGGTPVAGTNGTTRLAALEVVTANSFSIRLQTTPVIIGGFTDTFAGGDNAVFSINGALDVNGNGNDLNGNGLVDYRSPGSVVYGFEEFATKKSPLVGGGDGEYRQTIDATKLIEGFNYLEVRAFRSRPGTEPPVYSSFKKVIYVDRLPAVTTIAGVVNTGNNDRALRVNNPDGTVDSFHAFLDLGATLTDAQILSLVGSASQGANIDTNLFSKTFPNVGTGNHNLVYVAYEPSGRVAIERRTGVFIQTGRGRGLGDTNYDGQFSGTDIGTASAFEASLYSRGAMFNAASDLNADGIVDTRDLLALPAIYQAAGAASAINEAKSALIRRANVNGDAIGSSADIDYLFTRVGATGDVWLYDLNVDNIVSRLDVDTMVGQMFLTRYGDTNLDRKVDFSDLLKLAQSFGQPGLWATGDFDGDLMVDFDDLLSLAQNYGYVSLVDDGASVRSSDFWSDFRMLTQKGYTLPEPASFLTGVAAFSLIRRHRVRRS
jgi:hypothetical protein